MKSVELPVMWTISEASIESGISQFSIRKWIADGKVKALRLGRGRNGKVLVNAQSLCDYMSGKTPV